MRNRILTPNEREILQSFLDKNEQLEGFRMLKTRIKRSHEQLNQDFDLIDLAFKKFQEH
jgi:hypothetical protein